ELTARLLEGGVRPVTIADGARLVGARLGEVAGAMADLGWDVFAPERERISADEPVAEDVLARLEHLRSLAQRIVATLFRDLLDEAIRARSEPFAEQTVARRRRGCGLPSPAPPDIWGDPSSRRSRTTSGSTP